MRVSPLLGLALLALACASAPRAPAGGAAAAPRTAASPALVLPELEPRPGEARVAWDADGDGRPDRWRVEAPGAAGGPVPVREEKDLDGDGRVDTWEVFGADGAAALLAADLDGDGRPDTALRFEAGRLVQKEQVGVGGRARTISRFEGGRLVSRERDDDGDGRTDRFERWRDGELERAGAERPPEGAAAAGQK